MHDRIFRRSRRSVRARLRRRYAQHLRVSGKARHRRLLCHCARRRRIERGDARSLVRGRHPDGRSPACTRPRAGLYLIERDERGERSFLYWRDSAPAREFFDRADDAALDRLSRFDWLYLSGISLSLYGEKGRARLRDLLTAARSNGGRIAFDGNYRARGWSDAQSARCAFSDILPLIDLALPTLEDEQLLFGDQDASACLARLK